MSAMFTRFFTVSATLLAALSLLTPGEARAQTPVGSSGTPVEICNRTPHPVDCILVHGPGIQPKASGRYRIESRACRTMEEGESPVYYHCTQWRQRRGQEVQSGIWDGDITFCAPRYAPSFTLTQTSRLRENCEGSGYISLGFARADAERGRIAIILEDAE